MPLAPADLALDPLPLPPPGWAAASAMAALEEARPALPTLPDEVTVVSAVTTVVLRAGCWAVKVYPPGTDPAHLVVVADALAGSAVAVLAVGEPAVTSTGVVTVTPWVSSSPVGWPAIGALLRQFHAQTPAHPELPAWTPLRRLRTLLGTLPDELAAVLGDARETLLGAVAELSPPLPAGVIHGDVAPSNVLGTPSGPRLIDLDWVARGPVEYDLASAARRLRDGELDAAGYLGFCRAYGHDVRGWDGLEVLDRVAELGGLAFRIWDDRRHGRDLGWLPAAVARWRRPL
jgi:hypothetical protein